jgi:hypothetical protein
MVLVAASAFVYGGGVVQEDDDIGRQWLLCADAALARFFLMQVVHGGGPGCPLPRVNQA